MTEESARVIFSYDVATPLYRFGDGNVLSRSPWCILEKGSEKSEKSTQKTLSITIIHNALNLISQQFRNYECFPSSLLRDQGYEIYLKTERYLHFQTTKERGIMYTLLKLTPEQKSKGVVAVSTGDFVNILCYHGRKFNVPITVVVPQSVTQSVIDPFYTQTARTTVLIQGRNVEEAHNFALNLAQKQGLFYIDGHDHPNMIIGQATLGMEISAEIKNMDNIEKKSTVIILPSIFPFCGVTGGIAMAIKKSNPNIQIVEVVPPYFDPLLSNIRNRTMERFEIDVPSNIYMWDELTNKSSDVLFDFSVSIKRDESIYEAAKMLKRVHGIFEYNAAIGLASIIEGNFERLKGARVVIPLFGKMDTIQDLDVINRLDLSEQSESRPSTSYM